MFQLKIGFKSLCSFDAVNKPPCKSELLQNFLQKNYMRAKSIFGDSYENFNKKTCDLPSFTRDDLIHKSLAILKKA